MPFINRIGSGATRKFGFGAGGKPGTPTSVVGTPGNQQVSVAFTPPSALGTGAVSYTATSSPGSFTTTGASSPLVVTGLDNGTAYTFTVTATNSFGFSTSAASTSVTPRTVPSAPAAPTATRGNVSAAVSWTAPSDGGNAISDYVVQYSSDSGSTWTTFTDGVSTTTSTTVTGLANGTAYVFQIAAVNEAGTGSYSSASSSVTPATTPGAPTSVTATPGNVSAAVSWTTPASNGAAITDYVVQYSSNSGSSWTTFADGTSSSTSATVTGLANGTSYVFQVAATNSVGTGSYSTASSAVTPRTVPGAPASVTSNPSNGSVSIAFTAPSSNGGSAVTSYQYSTNDSTFVTAATNPFTVSGTNGTAITVYVRAVNVAGAGASTSAASTPRTVPDQVGTPTSSLGDRRFTISWTAPGNGGSAITGYRVQYSTNGGSTWTGDATTASTSYTFTLANGTSYVGRVQAINVAGDGSYSAASTARTPTFAAPGVSPANLGGYPNTADSNTWGKRPIRITFSPTACENYRDTYVSVIAAGDYMTAQIFGPYTSSTANQTVDAYNYTSVFGEAYIGLNQSISITVSTYNSENHGVSATTTHNTGAGTTHYTYTSYTYDTDVLQVTGTTYPRTFFNWFALSSQSVRSARVYCSVSNASYNPVTSSRNPSLGLSSAAASTGTGGGLISLLNLPNDPTVSGTTGTAWPSGGGYKNRVWNHADLNTAYDSAINDSQRYSIAGGGTLTGTWAADSRINTYLVITYENRNTNII
jgi:hypothetical protein